MRETELRSVAQCGRCKEKIGIAGIVFYRVRVQAYCLKPGAIKRQAGLEAFLGSVHLAGIMGPDEDLAEKFGEGEITLCQTCGTNITETCAAEIVNLGLQGAENHGIKRSRLSSVDR